ncbi:MAG: uridine kinase [Bacteroidota bacterium]|nr:uridine kinase [Bacteroidota bacterium]MDX5431790.1 uridine kinase [Bacteroidota bacterium]MDX5470503.1 uridine kinase [Bacteroidota bacterium]
MNGSYLIGISGGSASGKTSFIRAIREWFSTSEISLISQDNYYKEAHLHERDAQGHINYDLPECIDIPAFLDDLQALKKGQAIHRKEYLFQLEGREPEDIHVEPAPVIIVEGLFILHFREIFQELDLKIFIDADESIKLSRRIERDVRERGVSRDHVIYQWENHVKPSYRKFLEPYKNESDIIINNNEHFLTSLRVISDHIKNIIQDEL